MCHCTFPPKCTLNEQVNVDDLFVSREDSLLRVRSTCPVVSLFAISFAEDISERDCNNVNQFANCPLTSVHACHWGPSIVY